MRLAFVRHGESEANVIRQFSNQDHTKHPLTERGRQQVRQLAEALSAIRWTAIYSSPLLRAAQTAHILNLAHGLPVQITPALLEHNAGELEGRADAEAWALYSALFKTWQGGDLDARIPGGESYKELETRFVPFLTGVVEQYGGTEAQLLLVGHGGAFHMMLPLVLANVSYEFSYAHLLRNASLVLAEQRAEGLVCLSWDGVEMMPAPELES